MFFRLNQDSRRLCSGVGASLHGPFLYMHLLQLKKFKK